MRKYRVAIESQSAQSGPSRVYLGQLALLPSWIYQGSSAYEPSMKECNVAPKIQIKIITKTDPATNLFVSWFNLPILVFPST
mmetsp:Transcript_6939/g.14546  ORF Transcript_6939/g.14546 Transcript_6939/m.14546 type:complete len:82 (+) Transcript_6939:3739-3984(+)